MTEKVINNIIHVNYLSPALLSDVLQTFSLSSFIDLDKKLLHDIFTRSISLRKYQFFGLFRITVIELNDTSPKALDFVFVGTNTKLSEPFIRCKMLESVIRCGLY